MLVILAELQGCLAKLLEMVQVAIVTGVAPAATVNASTKKGKKEKKEKKEPSSFNIFIGRVCPPLACLNFSIQQNRLHHSAR